MKLTIFSVIFGSFFIICITLFLYLSYYAYSGVNRISSMDAKKEIQSGEIKHIIDVRSYDEWLLGHHPKAIHMPVSQIDEIKLKHIDNNDKILVYCNTGQQARYASEKIEKLGFNNVVYIASSHLSLL